MITQKRLKELLHYDPYTGVFIWKVSYSNSFKVGDIAGTFSGGYVRVSISGKLYLAHRLAWLYVHGYSPENEIDHKDRIRHHNWIDNLREATRVCNSRNTGNHKDNTSGVKGVCWVAVKGKWRARVQVNGKTIHLGMHIDFLEAACHRLAAEQSEGWSGCESSSPAYKYVMENIEKNND